MRILGVLLALLAAPALAVNVTIAPGSDVIPGGKLVTLTSDAAEGATLWFVRTAVDHEIQDQRLILASPCVDTTIVIDVVVIDWEARRIDSQKQITLEVDGDCEPDIPPEPDEPDEPDVPPEPGPFDNLAARVHAIAKDASGADRATMAAVMTEARGKMAAFEFKQIDQARDYIKRNWPNCEACGKVYDLIQTDAGPRGPLSWQEAQAYYAEIAKGASP